MSAVTNNLHYKESQLFINRLLKDFMGEGGGMRASRVQLTVLPQERISDVTIKMMSPCVLVSNVAGILNLQLSTCNKITLDEHIKT